MRAAWCVVLLVACGDDGAGSSCPEFTQIVDGTFTRTPQTLTWTLEVVAIPAELTFDQSAVPSFVEEYTWGVDVDTDDNGTVDYEVAAKHYRMDGPERIVTDVLAATQTDLWRVEGPVGTLVGSVDATLAGATFTFTVEGDEDPGLANVESSSGFVWRTGYQHGGVGARCEDSFE
jgi:hypothetical protein